MKEFCNILMAKDCIILDTDEDSHPDALARPWCGDMSGAKCSDGLCDVSASDVSRSHQRCHVAGSEWWTMMTSIQIDRYIYTIFLVQWAYKHCQNILKYNHKWPSLSTWHWDANLKKHKTDVRFQKHSWAVAEQRNVRRTILVSVQLTYINVQIVHLYWHRIPAGAGSLAPDLHLL